jgi:acyl-coenzyme A thioesterase PaaI-like protein
MSETPFSNFVGGQHENGFGLRFTTHPDGTVSAAYTFDPLKQGPPHMVQGGALAAVLDEAMTVAVYAVTHLAYTVNLSLDYRHPVKIGEPVTITGQLDFVDRRKYFASARILLAGGVIAVEAKALFIHPFQPPT